MNEPKRQEWVIMGRNGAIAVAIPLYSKHECNLDMGISLDVTGANSKPLAAIVDIGDGSPQVLSWDFITRQTEVLGDL